MYSFTSTEMPKSKSAPSDNVSGYTVAPYVGNKEDPLIHKLTRGSNNMGAEDIVPLTFPKIKPEDGVGMYMLSKLNENEPKSVYYNAYGTYLICNRYLYLFFSTYP